MRPMFPVFCATCGAEGADPCPECLADPTRADFVETCTRLLLGEGDRAGQVERARAMRESAGWSRLTMRQLLGSANRRAAAPLLRREHEMAGHGRREPGQARKRRSAAR